MRFVVVGLVLALAVVAIGCKGDGQAGVVGDGGGDGGATFAFTNATRRSIYIQSSGFSGQAYWSLTKGGVPQPVDNTCEVCDCGGCPSCAVCGRALARVEELKPGARHEWTWDGRIWKEIPDGCRPMLSCEQDEVVAAGAALQATVTYSFSFAVDPTFGADDEFIGTPLTAAAAFTNPPGAPVEITAKP